MTLTAIPLNLIERKPNSDKYRIIGTRLTVEFLVHFLNDPEWPVERLCKEYHLTPAQVHGAWAFYYEHQTEIDARLAQIQREALERDQEPNLIRERLLARYQAQTGLEQVPDVFGFDTDNDF